MNEWCECNGNENQESQYANDCDKMIMFDEKFHGMIEILGISNKRVI